MLEPILSVPLEGATSGTVTFSTNDLDTESNGSGFDVWILDGEGAGMAGPYFFKVNV